MHPNLRIWWVVNPPNDIFYQWVNSVEEAKIILKTLTNYDLYNDLIKTNAGGLEEDFDCDGNFEEWENEDGFDIWEIMEGEK